MGRPSLTDEQQQRIRELAEERAWRPHPRPPKGGYGMTDEQRTRMIAALIEERRGYLLAGKTDRAGQVDVQLRLLGAEGSPPAKRATKRTKKS